MDNWSDEIQLKKLSLFNPAAEFINSFFCGLGLE
jgi:hypothetical protein